MSVKKEKQKAPSILCIGGANVDHTYRLQQGMKQESSNPVSGTSAYGGVARNIAENLGRLNNPVALLSVVGEDPAGEGLLQHARRFMDVSPTEKLPQYNTGAYVAVIDQKGDLAIGFADMDIAAAMDERWVLRHQDELKTFDWLLADCNLQADALGTLVAFAREHKRSLVLIGVSSAKIHRLPKDLSGVKGIVCNLEESMAFFATDIADPVVLCKMWREAGVDHAVVTAGTRPYAFGNAEGVYGVPVRAVPAEQVADVTGAGDAFSAGTVYGLMQGKSLQESASLGEGMSRLTLRVQGPVWQELYRHRLEEECKK